LGATVYSSLKAAKMLEQEDVSAEVIDLRSLVPLDRETIINSVRKTGRLAVIDEDYHSFGVSGEIIASVCEVLGTTMKSAPVRVAYPDIPIPFSRVMEQFVLPNVEHVLTAVRQILPGYKP
jgi:pyruvate dehydrogenase E1 component beta subunit